MQPPQHISQLPPKQREVLEALLSGSTISDAASHTGVHRSTVHLWCRDNTIFRAALREAQSQQAAIALDGLRGLAARALQTLDSLLANPETPANVRFRAASMILRAVMDADPYTKPAGSNLTTAGVDAIIDAAAQVGSEEASLREAASPAEPPADTPRETPAANIARSAPCPCGSGEKFKRCCGRGAPGFVNQARAA